jgi:hypothetical protein
MRKLARERGKEVRNRPGGVGKWGENTKKILNRGNEPKDLLKAKELAFSGAENELVFQSQKPQTKRKMVAKRHDSYTGNRQHRFRITPRL